MKDLPEYHKGKWWLCQAMNASYRGWQCCSRYDSWMQPQCQHNQELLQLHGEQDGSISSLLSSKEEICNSWWLFCFFFFFSGGSGESKGKISVRKNKQANLYHLAVMKIQNVVQLPSPPMIIKPNSIRKGWSCCKKTDTRFTLLLETCINI